MNRDPRDYLSNTPVDYLEIRTEERRSTAVTYQGRELDEISEKEARGGSVRACHRGGWGFCSYNLPRDLDRAVREAADPPGRPKTGRKNLEKIGVACPRGIRASWV